MDTTTEKLIAMLEKLIKAYQETMDLEYGPMTEVPEIEEARQLIEEIRSKELQS